MRKRLFIATVVAVLASYCSPAWADAAPTAQEKLASVQYLVGTWNCKHTVGTFSGTYVTTYAPALGNLWLRQTYDFPKTSEGPGMQAEYFMGYDPNRQAWVRFGVMTTGQYFAIRMTDANSTDPAWNWKYVSFFPRRTTETEQPDATFTKTSDAQYTIDGPTYKLGGTGPTVTEHHTCDKAAP